MAYDPSKVKVGSIAVCRNGSKGVITKIINRETIFVVRSLGELSKGKEICWFDFNIVVSSGYWLGETGNYKWDIVDIEEVVNISIKDFKLNTKPLPIPTEEELAILSIIL